MEHTHVHTYSLIHVPKEAAAECWVSSCHSQFYCYETGFLPEQEIHCCFWLVWLVSSLDLPVPVPKCWGYKHAQSRLAFHADVGIQTQVLSFAEWAFSPAEPSPHAPWFWFQVLPCSSHGFAVRKVVFIALIPSKSLNNFIVNEL